MPQTVTSPLQPYLPRLVLDWQQTTPDALVREIEGSMVFVDISGFTKMSERLARQGKVGAEEVSDVIGDTFETLLAEAYARGGSLIKFGGDALLLFFEGQRARPSRGCAAHGMRAELRRVGTFETTSGKVTLRMSVGAHTGLFHFFLVGGSHRELIVAGPAATETVTMEGAASAGQILLSPALAAALPCRESRARRRPRRPARGEPSRCRAHRGQPRGGRVRPSAVRARRATRDGARRRRGAGAPLGHDRVRPLRRVRRSRANEGVECGGRCTRHARPLHAGGRRQPRHCLPFIRHRAGRRQDHPHRRRSHRDRSRRGADAPRSRADRRGPLSSCHSTSASTRGPSSPARSGLRTGAPTPSWATPSTSPRD